jgi:hypothetical protein
MEAYQGWLTFLIQGGFAAVSVILGLVVRAMWARTLELEKDKETILKSQVEAAREDTEESRALTKAIVEEQTRTRGIVERLERKLERQDP